MKNSHLVSSLCILHASASSATFITVSDELVLKNVCHFRENEMVELYLQVHHVILVRKPAQLQPLIHTELWWCKMRRVTTQYIASPH